MACYFTDNVHTKSFTPREYQVELLDAAKERNIIICLSTGSNKTFIALKLIQELSNAIRIPWIKGGKRTLYLGDAQSASHFARILRHLSDFRVGEYYTATEPLNLKRHQVLVTVSEVCQQWLQTGKLKWSRINLLIVEDCHNAIRNHPLRQVILGLKSCRGSVPKVLGLTSPLFINCSVEPGCVEAEVKHLEKDLQCSAETASDIVSILRYSAHPRELLIEYFNPTPCELSALLAEEISNVSKFLDDHRYDPTEIYEDEFLDEIRDIPDPKKDPFSILNDFMDILDSMGPWCADKAALLLLIHVEKLKVKTPYERHFLLLCLVSSVLLKIRAICDNTFQDLSEIEKINKYSSPKVLRLIEIVRQFKPKKSSSHLENANGGLKKGEKETAKKIESIDGKEINAAVNNLSNDTLNTSLDPVSNDCSVNGKEQDQDLVSDQSPDSVDVKVEDAYSNSTVDKFCCNSSDQPQSYISPRYEELITRFGTFGKGIISMKEAAVACEKFRFSKKDKLEKSFKNIDRAKDPGSPSENCPEPQDGEICMNGTDKVLTWGVVSVENSNGLNGDIFKTDDSNDVEANDSSAKESAGKYGIGAGARDSNGIRKTKSEGKNCLVESKALTVAVEEPGKSLYKCRGRGRGWRQQRRGPGGTMSTRNYKHYSADDIDNLCGIIFVQKRFTAKVLYHLLNDLRKHDPDFANISTQYTVGKIADPSTDPREAELEHRKQEDVLKRFDYVQTIMFRMRECNLVVATSVLEEGIELPRCNLVIRYDPVNDFKSHAHSKARARQQSAYYIIMIEEKILNDYLETYARYMQTERMLLRRCANDEPSDEEELDADLYLSCIPIYKPLPGENDPSVNMSSAVALVNRYCAKLPSDTFTRLTPLWSVQSVEYRGERMFSCTVRLPINSPVKQDIIGHPMPSAVLARRIAALETCKVLHLRGELDDQLEPIGKEAFNAGLEDDDLSPSHWDPNLPRPGTTKSRQYYYKRIANCLNGCRPEANSECILYNLDMVLTCPLPEEQNTRGRKLHPPELAPQAFGILTKKQIPKICPFPIFTRSGEVRVSLRMCSTTIVLTERQVETIAAFLNYIFTSVLRLQKYLMSFDPEAEENSFFIVPTKKNQEGVTEVDWEFLEIVYTRREECPTLIPEEKRKNFEFDVTIYSDAVVMPWYRNQDQPQYFYVAEICNHLSPKSTFPGSDYNTFEDYYHKKYGIQIQNSTQPLLDVDHTSARLNFLTPRYVNRKGVALPTSSEETKRAKRENLEQKQILVPELCLVHVVPASLWRQAVCLPCVLYRINALLLADEIRTTVACEIGLGIEQLYQDFEWPPLDFGWSLADVLKKSKEENKKKGEDLNAESQNTKVTDATVQPKDENSEDSPTEQESLETKEDKVSKSDQEEQRDDSLSQSDDNSDENNSDTEKEGWMEIGTWSNEMAQLGEKLDKELPDDLTMVRYGSPTSWEVGGSRSLDYYYSDPDSDDSSEVDDLSSVQSEESCNGGNSGLKITFKGDFLAEAIDEDEPIAIREPELTSDWAWQCEETIAELENEIKTEIQLFSEATEMNKEIIKTSNMLVRVDKKFTISKNSKNKDSAEKTSGKTLSFQLDGYGMPSECGPVTFFKTDSKFEVCTDHSESEDEQEAVDEFTFSFDAQPELIDHPGPSPSLILQALTMSNANDGINLERLETIGDSFLKYAITTYLYCTYENIHEGKLSHLRSKQVSNLNLYRLGRRKVFGESMIASKFEPHDNWLPPCYLVPRDAEQALLDAEPSTVLPYNLVTQHSIPDKSIADCVEALIGAYLIACGPRGALIFMSWLGIKVLPRVEKAVSVDDPQRPVGSTQPLDQVQVFYGNLQPPKSPLLRNISNPEGELERLMAGFSALENKLKYYFHDRAYLLQAMTHASYSPNRLTDCYQRLEFLGDAVLDYLITRHLYEDKRAHSPGALTDLRSALVNNTIFASLAVRHGLHKFFRHLSPGLGEVVQRFVTIQEENSHTISEEYYLVGEEAEDVEVPKALGDVFESVAGAIFLDSSMSLDTVWRVYYRMMKKEIEQFSTKVPKSPIRELLELEPETAKFGKPEKLADGRRVRVTVEVFGKGTFKGIGRNYRIAKCTAAKCALKQLKKKGLLARKLSYFNPPQDWAEQRVHNPGSDVDYY